MSSLQARIESVGVATRVQSAEMDVLTTRYEALSAAQEAAAVEGRRCAADEQVAASRRVATASDETTEKVVGSQAAQRKELSSDYRDRGL